MKEIGQDLIKKTLLLVIFQLIGNNLLLASNMNVDNLYQTCIEKFDTLLNTYA